MLQDLQNIVETYIPTITNEIHSFGQGPKYVCVLYKINKCNMFESRIVDLLIFKISGIVNEFKTDRKGPYIALYFRVYSLITLRKLPLVINYSDKSLEKTTPQVSYLDAQLCRVSIDTDPFKERDHELYKHITI